MPPATAMKLQHEDVVRDHVEAFEGQEWSGLKIRALRETLDLTQAELAALLHCSVRKITMLEGSSEPADKGTSRDLTALYDLYREACTVMKAEAVPGWLKRPSKAFGNVSPWSLYSDQGARNIYRALFRLQNGDVY